ncbi:xanthine dehydrogenase family protein molybdopterin-binding subunit [Saccharospirillum salsuginis]|uniref:Aldehyde dehydrogenase n=1 Tax=Saccharospirillum salsuginis TaxID=418750 RepID=A0A918KBM1_9GAMM|nr:molybdopterin cofactor-binding domain-containing protein [Saccharospirillum salsuginis]GGX57254.1 aldehyde dehydrogenase [Saccharospirillum salsuginis]
MSRLGKITRRTFLIGSATIAGGVAFGYYMYRRPHENPLLDDLAEGEAALTPYVKIDAEGVTLITPRTDLGQGAYSVQAALIAEELDIGLDQVRVDPGPPAPAYYNTALAAESVPVRSTNDGAMANTVRGVADAVMKFAGVHVTGGSSTVPDSYEKLRYAGAVARETLKRAASERTGLPVSRLKTEQGAVVLPDGSRLSYVELAAQAAQVEPVTDVELRPPNLWRMIGQPMQRHDIVAKSTGTAVYGIDLAVEGMVHATIKLNPRQGGSLQDYDATEALAMRGVQQVIPVTGGVGVIADNTWRAFKAAEAIRFDWGPAPYPNDMDEHWAALSNAFNEDQIDARRRDEGNVVEALDRASEVVEAEYRAPYLAHAPLEPINAIVRVNPDRVDVWTGTQIPRFVQANVAKIVGVDSEQVHIHNQMVGGSFGHRLEDEVVKRAAELAKALPGTPVKLVYSREEDMRHDFPRQIAMARGRGSVRDGRVEAYDLGVAMPSVTASQLSRQGLNVPGPDLQIIAGAWDQPFSIPHYRMTGYRADGLAPISSWRSVGASSNGFFHDCFLDELIHAAGADPMEERIRLCWHEPSRQVLETVKAMSGWTGPRISENRGRGVAFCLSFGVACAEVVEVTQTDRGIRIDTVYVAAEVGRVLDPINFENQVQGGVIWGLGHAMNCEITYADGQAEQTNYHAYPGLRLYQTPDIVVQGLENGDKVLGVGEPPVPPAGAALANAIFALTGQRIREMPLNKHIRFV